MSHGHAKGPAHTGHARAAHSSDGSTWVQYAQMDACVFTSSSLSVAELSVSSARAARGTFAGREWSSCVEGMREAAWMEAVLRAAAAARCSAVRRSRSSSTRRFVLAIVDTFAIRVGTRYVGVLSLTMVKGSKISDASHDAQNYHRLAAMF